MVYKLTVAEINDQQLVKVVKTLNDWQSEFVIIFFNFSKSQLD